MTAEELRKLFFRTGRPELYLLAAGERRREEEKFKQGKG